MESTPMNTLSLTRRQLRARAVVTFAPAWARAQNWPARPVRFIVAGRAGANADIIARLVSDPLQKELGQPVIDDNKPGAAGSIAVSELMSAPHDGYTFLIGVSSLVSEVPHIVKLRWDLAKEIKPLAELGRGGLVLVANPSVPAKNLQELVTYAKANPGKLNYASYSPGTLSHVLGLQLNKAAGIELTHVGYKGSSPALQDVMGNHVPLMFGALGSSLPLIKAGKVKALAVSSPKRMPQLPDVPTFRELGYPQLDAVAWMGLWCTPDVPAAIQSRVREATLKVLADPALKARMQETGFEIGQPRTTDEMSKGMKLDYDRGGGV